MSRRLLAVLGVLATVFVVTAAAQETLPGKIAPKNKSDIKRSGDTADPRVKIEDAATQQERLKRQFDDFKQKLLGLALRMENSGKAEDRDKAKILREAIKRSSEKGIETQFSSLIDTLKTNNAFKDTEQLQEILKQNEELRRNLREIMELLLKDDRDAEIRKKQKEYARLLEELKNVIRKQELVLNKTIGPRSKNKDLEKEQNKIKNQTDNLVNPKANPGAEAKHGEGKGSKSGKEGVGEAKNDAKDPKADNKDGKGEGKDGKAGEGKDAKSGEGKDSKQGEGKDGKSGEGKDAKPGEGKDGKGGEGKDGKPGEGKDSKASQGKDGKPGEGKDGKGGEGKDGKPGEGKDSKPGSGKPGDKPGDKPGSGKPSESKPGAGKPGAGKPSESKPGAGKPGESKQGDSKGKGEGKGDSKGKAGKSGQGKPGEGKPGQSGQPGQPGQPGQQGESKPGSKKSGQQPQQPTPEQSQIKKKIEDAEKNMDRAEDNLRKDNRKDAPEDQEKALRDLQAARKQLEDLLRQLREEEIERLLTKLEARCREMLARQKAVRDGTVELDKGIKANPKAEATRADQQASNVLSDDEDKIVKLASDGLRLLEAEGSAVAFAEVFQQVRGDMQTVATRLRKTDTGVVTVTIENQIIETLEEMIDALKKAQAENKKKSQQGKPGQSGPPPDPKLIDLLAELKMIRSMQKRVNSRTELYGKQYAGEQAPPVEKASNNDERERYDRIQGELKDLSKRQQKISKVTHDIATGKNEAK
ncbi:MAG TPA: hypothetical protein VN688_17645 [Gemmataceae bacterium]|nr:hypothetical protein [Gemmataceae bacterium]